MPGNLSLKMCQNLGVTKMKENEERPGLLNGEVWNWFSEGLPIHSQTG